MRATEPNDLRAHAFPILTARVSESELTKWFPVRFQRINDPQEAPEPSKAALIKLDTGDLNRAIALRGQIMSGTDLVSEASAMRAAGYELADTGPMAARVWV